MAVFNKHLMKSLQPYTTVDYIHVCITYYGLYWHVNLCFAAQLILWTESVNFWRNCNKYTMVSFYFAIAINHV